MDPTTQVGVHRPPDDVPDGIPDWISEGPPEGRGVWPKLHGV
ncbi:hypothetical protein [Streptomyces sp. NPDC055013]